MALKMIAFRVPVDVLEAFDEWVAGSESPDRTHAMVTYMRRQTGMLPPEPKKADCRHPRKSRQIKPWGAVCGECSTRVD